MKIFNHSFVLSICLLSATTVFAQNNEHKNWNVYPKMEPSSTSAATKTEDQMASKSLSVEDSTSKQKFGSSEVIEEPGIRELLNKHVSVNAESQKIDGYRIHLYSSSGEMSRTKAQKIQADFLKNYPDVPSYLDWLEPNFRVRVGDFRTRLDAIQFHQDIQDFFPSSFVVREEIELPPLQH